MHRKKNANKITPIRGARYNRRGKQGQVATELAIILAITLLALGVFLKINYDVVSQTETEQRYEAAQTVVKDLAQAATLVYQQGVGSSLNTRVVLPSDIAQFSAGNSTLSLQLSGRDDVVYENLGFTVSGTLPTAGGAYTIRAEAYDGYVLLYQSDSDAPSSVTNLQSTDQATTWIYWSWTNPNDTDFSGAIVYLDGVEKTTTTNTFYNATGLVSETNYTLTVHTQDTSGNINNTDLNSTAATIAPTGSTNDTQVPAAQICVAEDDEEKGTWADSCDGQYPNTCGDGDDLVGCLDAFSETHSALRSGKNYYYGGIKVTSYNTSVDNCESISTVMLCYDWWRSSTLQDCDISVDADGGASYTAVTTDCPGTSSAGTTCSDVTALETWTCNNFFSSTGTRALVKSEGQRHGGPGSTVISWDVLYFNVTFLKS